MGRLLNGMYQERKQCQLLGGFETSPAGSFLTSRLKFQILQSMIGQLEL